LFRRPVEASRVVAVHNTFMAEAVRTEVPAAEVVRVAMPMETLPAAPGAAAVVRARHGIPEDAFVVGCFGLLTREKQLDVVARAVARSAVHLPRVWLLLVGEAPDREAVESTLARAGVRTRTALAGRVPFADLAACLEAADVLAHLRYPTARETSAALLRALAQGRPTVISDLDNLAEVPPDAAVRVDTTDEEGGLVRAIARLAADPAVCARMGARARAFVATAHSAARCRQTYAVALARTWARPDPAHRA
jgi:glycosyltransferase involved in cell wall biosynthesis